MTPYANHKTAGLPITLILVLALLASALILPQANVLAASGSTTYYHYDDIAPNLGWSNNSFNANDISYSEGEVIPHAVKITGLAGDTTYGMWIRFDSYQSPACGFEYIAQYDTTTRLNPIAPLDGLAPTANGSLSTANGGRGGAMYTYGIQLGVVAGAAQSYASGSTTFVYIPVTFKTSPGATTAYLYFGIRLGTDSGCGVSTSSGARDWPGASLQTGIYEQNGLGETVPGISAGNMITQKFPLGLNPSGIQRSSFVGLKWNDLDGNAALNSEPGLAGWSIRVYNCGADATCTTTRNLLTSLTTTTSGYTYSASATPGNWYQACEVMQSNWISTSPVAGVTTAGQEVCNTPKQATVDTNGNPVAIIGNFGNWSPVDLSVTKTHGSIPLSVYDPIKYTIVVTNNGYGGNPINLTSTFPLKDVLPAYLKAVNTPAPAADLTVSGGNGGSCTVPYDVYGATISCTLNGLNYLSQVTIEFWVLQDPAPELSEIVNTATIANYNGGICPAPNQLGSQVEMVCANNTSTTTIQIGDPTSATVSALSAAAQETSIQVDWQTYSELDILGFRLLRSISLDGPRSLIYQAPAQRPGKIIGAAYGFVDTNVQAGIAYTYWLEVQQKDGSTQTLDPANANILVKIFLPTVQR